MLELARCEVDEVDEVSMSSSYRLLSFLMPYADKVKLDPETNAHCPLASTFPSCVPVP